MKTTVYVFCTNASGEPDIALYQGDFTQAQIDNGDHFDAARAFAADNDYEDPYLCVDEPEIGSLKARLDALYLKHHNAAV